MGLKSVFKTIKQEGYVLKPLDQYLISLNAKDNDRAKNVNAPSQAGGCLRANYYSRTGVQQDGSIDPRARRIFNNGDHVHTRLQDYLKACGLLLMDEVPLINEEYQIQGHTDGFLKLNNLDVGILEIKSINDNGYSQLKDAKEEHKKQGMVYLFCAEEKRKQLRATYKTKEAFEKSARTRIKQYEEKYSYFESGSKFTKEEKIKMQVDLNMKSDEILFNTPRPINKVVFLYENKNNQDIKEFVVERDNAILKEVLADYSYLNECVAYNQIPDRICPNKSCQSAKWCNYKIECFC